MWEGVEEDEVMGIVVGVVGGEVVVEIERMNCLHVPVCVEQVGEVGAVGYWAWRALVAEWLGKLSDGWREKQMSFVWMLPVERLLLTASTCAGTLFHWPNHSFV